MLKKIQSFLIGCFLILSFNQCAKRGSPTGGPKDETPPVFIKAQPPIETTNFNETRIRIYFDEYIKLKNLKEQLIISPPLENEPVISPQGSASKFIQIDIEDTLKLNTTYSFNFGQSIADNNESNALVNFQYVISTGDYIDSLRLKGVVKDAVNRKAEEFISVMLYKIDSSYTDSIVYQKPPTYLTNTLDSLPVFDFNYLSPGQYQLVAIRDENSNNLFDPSLDKFGFLDEPIFIPTEDLFLINLFKEATPYAAVVPAQVSQQRVLFPYRGPKHIVPEIELLTKLNDSITTFTEKIKDKDSLQFWIHPPAFDSLQFLVRVPKLNQIDTFTVRKKSTVDLDSLTLSLKPNGSLKTTDHAVVETSTPIAKIDSTLFSLFKFDSIPVEFELELDQTRRALNVYYQRDFSDEFKLNLLPGAVEDIFGTSNDSIEKKYRYGQLEDYGTLQLSIEGATYPIIVELLDGKDEIVSAVNLDQKEPLTFDLLEPATYGLRVIYDRNKNGRFDSGNWLLKTQAEEVKYFPDPIEVRANWEIDQTFIITN